MPVPPKDPSQRRRRNKDRTQDPLLRLPASGRSGPVPVWPLTRMQAGEKSLWGYLWRLPQAVAWESLRCERVVARYCRMCIRAESPEAARSDSSEVRQLEEKLGLTPMALLRLRWKIDDADELAERRPEQESSRRRLVALDAVAGA